MLGDLFHQDLEVRAELGVGTCHQALDSAEAAQPLQHTTISVIHIGGLLLVECLERVGLGCRRIVTRRTWVVIGLRP